jgi:hypothetical protein
LYYFSDAKIIEVKEQNNNFETVKDYSISDIIKTSNSIEITIKGWFILLITLIGFPFLVAWRSTLKKFDRKTGEVKKSIWDKLSKN